MPERLDRNYFTVKDETVRRSAEAAKTDEHRDLLVRLAKSYSRLAVESGLNITSREKLETAGHFPKDLG